MKELLQLAKEKGFSPNTGCTLFILQYYTENNVKGNTNKLSEYLILCEIQKWLLEKHGLFVSVELAYNNWGRFAAKVEKQTDNDTAIIALDGFTIYNTYEEALEEGLFEALKLI